MRVVTAAAALWLILPRPVDAAWRQLDFDRFLVVGDAREADLRRAAERFGAFAAAFEQLGSNPPTDATQLVIIVCGSRRTFESLRPRFNGRSVRDIGGFFQPGPETQYIVLGGDGASDDVLRVVQHEFAHALLARLPASTPAWVAEGLAEYYSTFTLRADGRGAEVGHAVRQHLETLQTAWLPLAPLLAVSHDSPFYNEDVRRNVFYAESWALVHFLVHEAGVHLARFEDYATQIERGVEPDAAFSSAFGIAIEHVERALTNYVRRPGLQPRPVPLSRRDANVAATRARSMTPAAADALVAGLLAAQLRDEEAVASARRALAGEPGAAAALVTLGRVSLRRGDSADAVVHLRSAAAAAAPEFSAHLLLGQALLADAQRSGRQDPRVAEACAALSRATDLRPTAGTAWAWLARCQLRRGDTPAAPLASASRAVQADPANLDHQLVLARAALDGLELPTARSALTRVHARGDKSLVVQADGLLLALRAVELERDASAAFTAQPSDEDRQRAAGEALLPLLMEQPADGGRNGGEPAGPNAIAATAAPLERSLRPLREGERREWGYLSRIECSPPGVAIRVQLPTGVRRLAATRLDQVLMYSFRSDVSGDIACGTQQAGKRVLLTWTPSRVAGAPSDAFDGRAIAVEFVPASYVPAVPPASR